MNIKKGEVVQLWNTIEQLRMVNSHIKFTYALAKNKKILSTEVESIQEAISPSEEFKTFEGERLSLCRDMSKKDENGEAIIINGREFDIEDMDEFEAKLNDLKDNYKETIDKEMEKNKQALEMLEEEVDLDLAQLHLDYFPEGITPAQMETLMFLVKE